MQLWLLTEDQGAINMCAHQPINSALAQLVEQMTVNHWVAGSSPAGGANLNPR